LNVGQNWISTGRTGPLSFVFGLHGGVLAISLMWLFLRHTNWSWRNWMPVLRPTQRTAT
jgi:lipopolysaccharide export system permease protein